MTRIDRALCMLYDGDASGAVACADQTLHALTPDRRAGIIAMRGHDLLAVLPPGVQASASAGELRDLLLTPVSEVKEIMAP
jgi:hypothetical protein